MKIAVLGGSFNPVHSGHLGLASDVHRILGYDLILLIPAHIPPHKTVENRASGDDRLAMLRCAVDGFEYIKVEDCELVRLGVSFTIDTIEYLEKKYTACLDGKIGLIIGQDLIEGFDAWKNAPLLAEKTDIIVAGRPGSKYIPFAYPHTNLENKLLDITSSQIRRSILEGRDFDSLVPEAVSRYIKQNHLYEH